MATNEQEQAQRDGNAERSGAASEQETGKRNERVVSPTAAGRGSDTQPVSFPGFQTWSTPKADQQAERPLLPQVSAQAWPAPIIDQQAERPSLPRIPIPAPLPPVKPARPMPALQYQLQRKQALVEATQPEAVNGKDASARSESPSVGAVQQAPRLVPDHEQVFGATGKGDERAALLAMNPPLFMAPVKRKKAIGGVQVAVGLVVLVVLVIVSSLVGTHLLDGNLSGNASIAENTPNSAFIQAPLSAAQINELRHIVRHMQYKQLASLYVSRMTLDEEIGQLIMVEYGDTSYSDDLDTMINKQRVGGVIMYEFQMLTAEQTKRDIAQMQKRAAFPLFISTDEEGGPYVHRLNNIYPPRMSALDIYNSGDINVATHEGQRVAHDLLALGINEDLAPDVDVALVNGVDQETRTFGFTANSVIKYAGPYMKAMQSDGVIACIKHFPGLGDANIDAHLGLPVVNRTKDQIYAVELAPFAHFIQTPDTLERPGMIMPTDVLMPAIDPVMPAELSHIFMTDILRKQLGYDGVTLTDALYMKGVVVNGVSISMPEAGVLALKAGNDMLLGPTGSYQTQAMIDAIKAALQNGTLSKARIDEAATRIIVLKMERHLMPAVPPQI